MRGDSLGEKKALLLAVCLLAAFSFFSAPALASEQSYIVTVKQAQGPEPMESKAFSAQKTTGAKSLDAEPLSGSGAELVKRFSGTGMVQVKATEEEIEELKKNPEVLRVEPDYAIKSFLDVSVPTVKASGFWDNGFRGAGTVVAVVDSGIKQNHDYLEGTETNGARSFQASDFSTDSDTDDLYGHGTHVTGIIASTHSTYKGIAPNIPIIVNAKHLNSAGVGSSSTAQSALDWAINTASPAAFILNNSWGSPVYESDCSRNCVGTDCIEANGLYFTSRFVDFSADKNNVIHVMAAGNDGLCGAEGAPDYNSLGTPADAYNGITVASAKDNATTSRDDDSVRADSSRGPTSDGRKKPDILAPGNLILSTHHLSETPFAETGGTSMAAPHVTGAAVLIWNAGVNDAKAIKAILLNSSDDVNESGWDRWTGWGYLNLENAYSQKNHYDVNYLQKNSTVLYSVSLADGAKATLVWNRRLNSDWSSPYDLSDLNLYLYNVDNSLADLNENSTIDNVEQIFAPSAGNYVVSVVSQQSDFDGGISDENYALAFSSGFSRISYFDLNIAFDANSEIVRPNDHVRIDFNAVNAADLNAFDFNARVILPAGMERVDGNIDFNLGSFMVGGNYNGFVDVGVGVEPGTHAVNIIVDHNSYGYNWSETRSVSITIPEPVVEIDVDNNTWQNDRNIHLSCSVAGGTCQNIYYWLDFDESDSVVFGDQNTYDYNILLWGDGNFAIDFNAVDDEGAWSDTNRVYILIDTNAPVTVDDHNAGWQTVDQNIGLDAVDRNSGVSYTRYRVNSGEWLDYNSGGILFQNGNARIDYYSADNAGNLEEAKSIWVAVDTVGPATSDDHNAGWQSTDAYVKLSCTPIPGTSCSATRYMVNQGDWLDYNSTGILVQDGNVRIDYNSTDDLGVAEAMNTVWVAVDKAVPSASISSPASDATITSSTVSLSYSCSDSLSGLSSYQVSEDNSSWTSTGTTGSHSFTSQSNGSHTYYVKCWDKALNESPVASVSVTVSVSGDDSSDDSDTTNTTPGASTSSGSGGGGGGGTNTTLSNVRENESKSYDSIDDGSVESVLNEAGITDAAKAASFKEASKKFSVKRSVEAGKTVVGSSTSYSTTFTLEVSNTTGNAWKNVKVVEVIPKSVAKSAKKEISSSMIFTVLKDDPVIEFTVDDVAPNSTASVSYSVNYWNKTSLADFSAPAIAGEEQVNACASVNCDDSNPCTVDSCSGGECSHSNADEGTACGANGECREGECILSSLVEGDGKMGALADDSNASSVDNSPFGFMSSFVSLGSPWTRLAFLLVVLAGSVSIALLSFMRMKDEGFEFALRRPEVPEGSFERLRSHVEGGKENALARKKQDLLRKKISQGGKARRGKGRKKPGK